MSHSYANDVPSGSEQVQVSPAQAVSSAETALAAAETELIEVIIPSSASVSSDPEVQTAISTASQEIIEAETAISNVNTAITVVSQKQTIVTNTQATLSTEQQELIDIQNAPLGSMNYTTSGYVAPVAPETPTVTTTVLPAMGDASTKINVPFDIKMGDTVFEGQGSASQIYVSSKAIISFGGPDYTFWDWPNMVQDGIYVFQSDYTSFGTGASITVTTTETTLSVDWDLHRWGDLNGPLTNINWNMTVNPETGEWTGQGTIDGNTSVWGGPRTGVRQDGVLQQQTVYTSSNKQQAITAQQSVVTNVQGQLTIAQSQLTTAQTNLTNAIGVMNTQVSQAVVAVEAAATAVEDARYVPAPSYSNITFEPSTPDTPIETDTEEPSEPTEDQPPQEDSEQTDEATEDQTSEEEQTSGEEEQQESDNQEQESQSEEPSSEPTTPEEAVDQAVEEALADGELTSEEKEIIAEALLAEAAGEAISAETLAEAGLTYSDLPPATPVEVRTDENGNPVIIKAEVAAALQLFEDPAALISGVLGCFNPGETDEELTEEQKCQVLTALANIGADMSPQEREEAEKMVVAAIIASGAALNAVGIATGGSAPTGGGSSGGGGPSGDSKGVRRRRP